MDPIPLAIWMPMGQSITLILVFEGSFRNVRAEEGADEVVEEGRSRNGREERNELQACEIPATNVTRGSHESFPQSSAS